MVADKQKAPSKRRMSDHDMGGDSKSLRLGLSGTTQDQVVSHFDMPSGALPAPDTELDWRCDDLVPVGAHDKTRLQGGVQKTFKAKLTCM